MAVERDRLLAAAREEFWRCGYKKAGIAAIAERAGIAVGSVYAIFGSKQELFVEVYQAENEQLKKGLVEGIDWSKPRSAVTSYIRANLAAIQANPILAEWNGETVGAVLRSHYQDLRCPLLGDFFAERFHSWCTEGRVASGVDEKLLDEIYLVAQLIDASGQVSMATITFFMEAIVDRLFPDAP